jgi:hypothetical protein
MTEYVLKCCFDAITTYNFNISNNFLVVPNWLIYNELLKVNRCMLHGRYYSPSVTNIHFKLHPPLLWICRSQWPRGLSRQSAASRLLRSWLCVSPGAWMSVCCECFVLSHIGLCDELISRLEESYRLWCVIVYDLETARIGKPWPALGRSSKDWLKTRSMSTDTNNATSRCVSPAILFSLTPDGYI